MQDLADDMMSITAFISHAVELQQWQELRESLGKLNLASRKLQLLLDSLSLSHASVVEELCHTTSLPD